ncbi:unnamed protein product [Blepharisma stoltei]|uniref:Major facilitator superfamily (MFS) profile domain-containing protein n=1 Tax=Blepharisma stoltei TaxID=1481888 RepID=A0AAU9K5S7_9CILI|nr:unnamed protein product [Blepharisma stoltei]
MEETKKSPTPLPKLKSFVVLLAMFIEAMCNAVLFPFVAYMVADFFYWLDRDDKDTDGIVSFYSGLVVSCFNLAQFISAPTWGWISDRIGRRPVILLGLLGNVITAPLFGIAPTYLWAVIFRCLNGLANGNTGIIRAYATEITDVTNSAKLFSYMGISWGVGITIGPSIGGSLSRISEKIPSVFSSDGFFSDHPYFLPMLASSFISLIVLIVGYYVLDETNKKTKTKKSILLLCKNKHFLICAVIYAMTGLLFTSFSEVFTFWCRALKSNGGLGWNDESNVGIVQSFGGGSIMISQIFVVPWACNYFGILSTLKIAWVILIPFFIILPNIYVIEGIALWIIVISIFVSIAVFQSCVFTAVTIGINNSLEPSLLGTGNGVAQSAISLLRFLGPALAGAIFGWSLNNGLSYPMNSHLIFILFAIIGICCIILLIGLDKNINKRKVEADILVPLLNKEKQ